jgi:tetratricopeptide (TPR) repeat protein
MTGTADIAAGEDDWRRLIARYFERYPEQRGTKLERQAWAAMHLNRGRAYGRLGQHRDAARCLIRAFAVDPAPGAKELALLAARAVVPRRWRDAARVSRVRRVL